MKDVTKRTLTAVVTVAAVMTVVVWSWDDRSSRQEDGELTGTQDMEGGDGPGPEAALRWDGPQVGGSGFVLGSGSDRPANPGHARARTEVQVSLEELRALYTDAGALDWDAARNLIEDRKKRVADLERHLADLGDGSARALAEALKAAILTRDKLLLARALGKSGDSDAVAALEALLQGEEGHSVRAEMVAALGRRGDSESTQVLAGLLDPKEDPRLRVAAVHALSGREEALGTLAGVVGTDDDLTVRLEAIRSVGRIGSDGALDLLHTIADSQEIPRLREQAIQEMARSYPFTALPALESLVNDADETIRASVVLALSRMESKEAIALLRTIAATDASARVREKAASALPTEG